VADERNIPDRVVDDETAGMSVSRMREGMTPKPALASASAASPAVLEPPPSPKDAATSARPPH